MKKINILKYPTRRSFISGLALFIAGISVSPKKVFPQSQEAPDISLNLVRPKNYLPRNTISKISSTLNIPIRDKMYEGKKNNIEEDFDIFIGRNDIIETAIDAGKLSEIDNSLIPNRSFINEQFLTSFYDPGRKYSIPLTWGGLGIIYRKDKFDEPPNSWRWLLDSDKYSGKVALIGEGRTLIQIALKYMGVSLNTDDPMWINQAEKLLKRQKEHIKDFGNNNGISLLTSGEVDLAISSNDEAAKVISTNNDIGFVFPREGSLIWEDAICIAKSSNKMESAHYFINSLLDAKIGKNIAEENSLATSNMMALDISSDSYKNDGLIFPNDQIIERYEDTSNILGFDYEMMIDEMWKNIKDA